MVHSSLQHVYTLSGVIDHTALPRHITLQLHTNTYSAHSHGEATDCALHSQYKSLQ